MCKSILFEGQESCKEIFSKTEDSSWIGQTGELLSDRRPNGEERPWRAKRLGAIRLAGALRAIGLTGNAARCRGCGTVLVFNECPSDGQKRLQEANFCRERLCPMCAWRRSLRLTYDVSGVLHEAARREPRRRWVMLTLTQKNVPGEALAGEVDRVLRGWNLLRRRRELLAVAGTFRVLELTRNTRDGTWHPHVHALLWVLPSYFNGNGSYITQARWRELWAEALGLDYLPVVDVHAVKARAGARSDLDAAALEVGKYTVKDADLVPPEATAQEVIERVTVVRPALYGRRLIAWGGGLREIARELRLKDPDAPEADLVHVTDEDHGDTCPVCGSEMRTHVYRWIERLGQYVG